MEHAQQTINDLEARLKDMDKESRKIKAAINCLYEVMGKPAKYKDIEEKQTSGGAPRPDEYHGRPLATVVTEVLDKRKSVGLGSISLDEIYNELMAGGFEFIGKNDGIKKRGLAISMSKNPKFHKLSNETLGLTAWYPNAKENNKELKTQGKAEETLGDAAETEEIATLSDSEQKK